MPQLLNMNKRVVSRIFSFSFCVVDDQVGERAFERIHPCEEGVEKICSTWKCSDFTAELGNPAFV